MATQQWIVTYEFEDEGPRKSMPLSKKGAQQEARYLRNTGAKNIKIERAPDTRSYLAKHLAS